MIKNLTSSNAHLTVSTPYSPSIYNNGQVGVGNVRYNTTMQQLDVYDGSQWLVISNSATVGLSFEADSAVRWAIEKQKEELELKAKMDKYPALRDAYDQLEMVKALVHGELDEQE